MKRKSILLISFFLLAVPLVGITTYLATRLQSQDPRSRAIETSAITLSDGPHLFIDDYLIESSSGVERRANASGYPRTKVIPSASDVDPSLATFPTGPNGDFNSEVLYDPQAGVFRLWHEAWDMSRNRCDKLNTRFSWYRESTDGIHFSEGQEAGKDCRQPIFGFLTVEDTKIDGSGRYRTIYTYYRDGIRPPGGYFTYSADGKSFVLTDQLVTQSVDSEMFAHFYDPKYKHYGMLSRLGDEKSGYTDPYGNYHGWFGYRRWIAYAQTNDFMSWGPYHNVFDAEEDNQNFATPAITQFYANSNAIRRGNYLIATQQMLRDDLKAEGTPDRLNQSWHPTSKDPFPIYGIGYTVLAWSRDGEVDGNGNRIWHRDKVSSNHLGSKLSQPSGGPAFGEYYANQQGFYNDPNVFFAPSLDSNAFDHAHAWIDTLVEIPAGHNRERNPTVYLYYGGYKYGHKIYTDRSIGLVKIKKDRLVGRIGRGTTPGKLTTRLFTHDADILTVNADTEPAGLDGYLDIRILGANNYQLATCMRVDNDDDVYSAPVNCTPSFGSFKGRPIKLEFSLKETNLFAFYLDGDKTVSPSPTSTPQPTPTPTIGDVTPPTPGCEDQKKAGDFDCNGEVNYRDFEVWQNDYLEGKTTLSFFEYWRRVFFRE